MSRKMILPLFSALFVASCATTDATSPAGATVRSDGCAVSDEEVTEIAPSDAKASSDQNVAAVQVSIQSDRHGYDDPADHQKAQAAILLLEKILNSPKFHERVKAFAFNKRGRNGSYGLSSAEVLAVVLSGADLDTFESQRAEQTSSLAVPRVLKLKLHLDQVSRHEIGHTNLETNEVFTGIEWFRENDVCEVAAHYLHEYSHTVGFGHTFLNVLKRPRSVPYGLGEVASDVARELTSGTCTVAAANP